MVFTVTRNEIYLILFVYFNINDITCIVRAETSCPTMSCDVKTLENGETVAMVPKSLANEDAWWLKDIPELKNVPQRLVCALPDCLSNPCQNGATCTETFDGFYCTCPTEFYGELCNCPIIHTPDVGNTKNITYHGLNMTQGVTSFHFEVSANNDATLVLLQSFDEEDLVYILVIGKYNNGKGCLRRRSLESFKPLSYSYACLTAPTNLVLSGIPTYDHYQLSIEGKRIKVRHYGSDVTLMDYNDPNLLSIKYVGIFTGWGSEGYWKFPTFC